MDAWTYFKDDNNGNSPENVFQLINYSRATDKIPTLSYNKALIIFEKHTMDNNKKSSKSSKKKKKKTSNKTKRKSNNNNNTNNKTDDLISLSITSPTSPQDQPSALSINSSDSDNINNNIPKYKKNKIKNKNKKSRTSQSSHNLMSLSESKSSKKKKKKATNSPISPSSPIQENIEYYINDYVLLSKDREGVIRFIGDVHFTKGIVYGIELMNGSMGKHDGMIDNERYFQVLFFFAFCL